MLNDKQVQELFESAIALVEHDGYKVPDCLNRKTEYNRCKKLMPIVRTVFVGMN